MDPEKEYNICISSNVSLKPSHILSTKTPVNTLEDASSETELVISALRKMKKDTGGYIEIDASPCGTKE
ncbi:hypothetical protein [Butyrivibrio sp. AC2005]|uniref:hypothetical protein n=1 Tax=Butyrivibrio sp. AC2005 TaxID=1280672 RepID=UPI0004147F17|nr:hypothetical protein [Butyrivibrio sp. AC2005]